MVDRTALITRVAEDDDEEELVTLVPKIGAFRAS